MKSFFAKVWDAVFTRFLFIPLALVILIFGLCSPKRTLDALNVVVR